MSEVDQLITTARANHAQEEEIEQLNADIEELISALTEAQKWIDECHDDQGRAQALLDKYDAIIKKHTPTEE